MVRRGETGQPGVSKNLGLEELEEFGEEIGTRCQKTEYTSILDDKFKCWIKPFLKSTLLLNKMQTKPNFAS